MIETYSSKLATRRWPVALFCNLLDIAALNAYVLFEKLKMDGAGKEKRRLFTKRLGKGLCQELQEHRRLDATLPSLVTALILKVLQRNAAAAMFVPNRRTKRLELCARHARRMCVLFTARSSARRACLLIVELLSRSHLRSYERHLIFVLFISVRNSFTTLRLFVV